jgi:hypothetical protein
MILARVLAIVLLLIVDQSTGLSADVESVWRAPVVAQDVQTASIRTAQDDGDAFHVDGAAARGRVVVAVWGSADLVAQDAARRAVPIPGASSGPRSPPSA